MTDSINLLASEVARLQAENERLREGFANLIESADLSDECAYGTLGTAYVREIAAAALSPTTKTEEA